ncbi:DUF1501 domain-containing protein [Luteimonas sp. 100069]|uniref:DUF1501 domain-containing protein n=1 Tax=Luteimonas sp. 100069 TaxID=2006109 RepID=UPI000F514186|nr:DUF1501 domain-containing protein [Luteimonas sp. 100069]RPD88609.1 DUF1501 domain-containing protein [Luteimonas sp. 100069]
MTSTPTRGCTRRGFLRAAGMTGGLALLAPRLLLANAATERRFVFVIQRGAADGLDTLVPYADPAYAALRGGLAIDASAAHRLDGSFALHPALNEAANLFAAKQALFVHAVASPYRERSHFDGQNVLETGGAAPHRLKDGWLNRLAALLPSDGREPLALASTVPTALRGDAKVASYAPSALPDASDDLLLRVGQLYASDPLLGSLWESALRTRGIAGEAVGGPGTARRDAEAIGTLAAGFLARPDGPRIAMIETQGWDTHSRQQARLATHLGALDRLLGALRDGLGPAWAQTVVLVATEFGRTAAINGTGGTDHGTGSAAMLVGGAVRGGRVLADWPGLAPGDLYEGRDLRPTMDLDALIASAVGECFSLEPGMVARTLFPRSGRRATLPSLLRS